MNVSGCMAVIKIVYTYILWDSNVSIMFYNVYIYVLVRFYYVLFYVWYLSLDVLIVSNDAHDTMGKS